MEDRGKKESVDKRRDRYAGGSWPHRPPRPDELQDPDLTTFTALWRDDADGDGDSDAALRKSRRGSPR